MSKQQLDETTLPLNNEEDPTTTNTEDDNNEEEENMTADEKVLQDFYKKVAEAKTSNTKQQQPSGKQVPTSTYEEEGEGAHFVDLQMDKTKLSKTDIRTLHREEVKLAKKELEKIEKPETFPNHAELSFFGASGTVTGSKHMVTYGSLNVLVDCGMYQGLKELR